MKKGWKIAGISLLLVILLVLVVLLSYVAYLSVGYYRIKDNLEVAVNNNTEEVVELNKSYSISTYNIGFGAYSPDFSFFMDSGEMLDGTKVSGNKSRASSEEVVLYNTNGAIETIQNLNTDFSFFQEVDIKADRSHFVNQYEMICESFSEYSNSYVENMHTGYLIYPPTNPIGAVKSGQVTLSKYQISESVRRSFPIDESFIQKFFDLDRCFEVNYLPIQNTDKQLVLINLHMSAYDEGGKIREKQLDMLLTFMEGEYNKGNYVIAGGDWNHDIADSINTFTSKQKVPEWVKEINESELPEHFSFAKNTSVATCRSTDMPYEKGVNYTVVLDGFLVSDNIQIDSIENIDTDFEYSDHNPAYMTFTLLQEEETGETIE